MARGENPGVVLSIQTGLTYDKNVDFGHESAGKDLALSIGSNGQGKLAGDGEKIIGKFLDLDQNGVASYMATGTPLILRKTAAAITPLSAVVGAGGGKVKSDASAASRGLVTRIIESADNGRILVLLPA